MSPNLLITCEHEPLHLSGRVQPHGALLMTDAQGRITHLSANAPQWLGAALAPGMELPPALAQPWSELGMAPGDRGLRFAVVASAAAGGAPASMLDLCMNRGEDGVVALELFPAGPAPGEAVPHDVAESPPDDDVELAAQRQRLVEEVLRRTGYQRVLYYAFREDGDGDVIAEARDGAAFGSYLGLRFPSHDIPQIARRLYVRNPWRLIPDALAEPIPVLGRANAPMAGSVPDLTWSDLRSASPVHCAYLTNMGVRASLSFPVVVNGQLVALVAAHHDQARPLALGLCDAVAAQVRRHAMRVTTYQARRRLALIDAIDRRFDPVRDVLARHGSLDQAALDEFAPDVAAALQADGIAVLAGDRMLRWGTALEPQALAHLDGWLASAGVAGALAADAIAGAISGATAGANAGTTAGAMTGIPGGPAPSHPAASSVWQSDCLVRDVPRMPPSAVSGVTAIRARRAGRPPLRVYVSRREYEHDVHWGGRPERPTERADGLLDIRPRRSFETWIERRLGHSRPWDTESRLLALKLRETLLAEALR